MSNFLRKEKYELSSANFQSCKYLFKMLMFYCSAKYELDVVSLSGVYSGKKTTSYGEIQGVSMECHPVFARKLFSKPDGQEIYKLENTKVDRGQFGARVSKALKIVISILHFQQQQQQQISIEPQNENCPLARDYCTSFSILSSFK